MGAWSAGQRGPCGSTLTGAADGMWELRFSVGAAAHLEQDLQGPVDDAHPPSEEDEEGHHQLQEVVAEGLEAVEPPRGAVQEVGHRVGHRLCLGKGGPELCLEAPGGPSLHTLPRVPPGSLAGEAPRQQHTWPSWHSQTSRTSDADPSGTPEGPGDQVLRGRGGPCGHSAEPLRLWRAPHEGTGCREEVGWWELSRGVPLGGHAGSGHGVPAPCVCS